MKNIIFHTEKEIKRIITKEEYHEIKNKLDGFKLIKQENFYFDTPNFDLYNAGITIKIRKISDYFKLFIKSKKNSNSLFCIRKEATLNIDNISKFLSIKDLQTKLDNSKFFFEEIEFLKINTIEIIGSTLTERMQKKFDYYELCLDKNYYLDKIDYELELEITDLNYNLSKDSIFSEINAIGDVSKSKFIRFVNEFQKRNTYLSEKEGGH